MVFIEKENKQMLGRNIEIIAGIRVTRFQGEKNPKDLHQRFENHLFGSYGLEKLQLKNTLCWLEKFGGCGRMEEY